MIESNDTNIKVYDIEQTDTSFGAELDTNDELFDVELMETDELFDVELMESDELFDAAFDEDEQTMEVEFEEVPTQTPSSPVGTTDHSELINRDKPKQHPIKAIDGLEDALAGKQPKGNYLTKVPYGYVKSEELKEYAKSEELKEYAKSEELKDYAKSEELKEYAKSEELKDYAKSEELKEYAKSEELEEYAKYEELEEYAKSEELEGYAKSEDVPVVPEWAMQPAKPNYTVDEVGADPSGSATKALEEAKTHTATVVNTALETSKAFTEQRTAEHNTDTDAHNDLRLFLKELNDKVNHFLDIDDTTKDQASEIVKLIEDNRDVIEQITTDKINFTDIVDNLSTNVSNKPLSAAQGVMLKALIDKIIIPTMLSAFTNDVGYLTEHQSLVGYATEAWVEAKKYLTEHQDLSDYAKKIELPTVPTKVSAFDNDAGYLKEQSLDGYVKQSDVDSIVQSTVAEILKTYFPYTIGFDQGKLYAPATSASYTAKTITDNSVTFEYRGGSGVEELVFPITGLIPGRTYTLSFDETYNGTYIQDTYRYGCGIMQKSVYNSTTFPTNLSKPSWVVWHTGLTGTQKGNITFTAESDTVYWVWSLGRLSDGKNVNITFNAKIF